jgi:hypothetical protein
MCVYVCCVRFSLKFMETGMSCELTNISTAVQSHFENFYMHALTFIANELTFQIAHDTFFLFRFW